MLLRSHPSSFISADGSSYVRLEREQSTNRGPLSGLRVIDTTQYVAGPFCSLLLADLGADVIKIERPGHGDVYREQGPHFINGESVTFLGLNRNKQSVTINLKDERGVDIVRKLIAQADVFVENSKPGTMTSLGLGYEVLSTISPQLVYCSVSGYGQTGPYAARGGYDLTVQSESGIMSVTGEPGGPPVKVGVPALDFGSAMYGVIGILAAIVEREKTGRGKHVDVALFDGAVSWLNILIVSYLATGEVPKRMGSASPFFAPYQAYATKDGYITVTGTGGSDAWGKLCRVLGREELRDDDRFASNSARIQHLEELTSEIEEVLRGNTTAEWLDVLGKAGIPSAALNTVDMVIKDPQVAERRMLLEVDHPRAGRLTLVSTPVHYDGENGRTHEPPPLLGQHTEEVLLGIGYTRQDVETLRREGVV